MCVNYISMKLEGAKQTFNNHMKISTGNFLLREWGNFTENI